jgi:hypothetical protein
VECKWSVAGFETRGLDAFRQKHPWGRNILVVPDEPRRERTYGDLTVTITSLEGLPELLA